MLMSSSRITSSRQVTTIFTPGDDLSRPATTSFSSGDGLQDPFFAYGHILARSNGPVTGYDAAILPGSTRDAGFGLSPPVTAESRIPGSLDLRATRFAYRFPISQRRGRS